MRSDSSPTYASPRPQSGARTHPELKPTSRVPSFPVMPACSRRWMGVATLGLGRSEDVRRQVPGGKFAARAVTTTSTFMSGFWKINPLQMRDGRLSMSIHLSQTSLISLKYSDFAMKICM